MNKPKSCPFCGHETAYLTDACDRDGCVVECAYCAAQGAPDELEEVAKANWNRRTIEDALTKRAEAAEAIIRGMFPLWIAAMSYAEYGRAADMNRIRNYYNGRDNPLTDEQIKILFSMIGGEK